MVRTPKGSGKRALTLSANLNRLKAQKGRVVETTQPIWQIRSEERITNIT